MARRRTVEEAHRCGYLLADARRTADRRAGGFRGVLERSGIPRRTAYRLIELDKRSYCDCTPVTHDDQDRPYAWTRCPMGDKRWRCEAEGDA